MRAHGSVGRRMGTILEMEGLPEGDDLSGEPFCLLQPTEQASIGRCLSARRPGDYC